MMSCTIPNDENAIPHHDDLVQYALGFDSWCRARHVRPTYNRRFLSEDLTLASCDDRGVGGDLETGYDGPQSTGPEGSRAASPNPPLDSRKGDYQIRWPERGQSIKHLFGLRSSRKGSLLQNDISVVSRESKPEIRISREESPSYPFPSRRSDGASTRQQSIDLASCPELGRPSQDSPSPGEHRKPSPQNKRLQACLHEESPPIRETVHKFRSLGQRFRRSKSVSTVPTLSEFPNLDARERRRQSRESFILSELGAFSPLHVFSGFRPDLIAIAGVMIATGELDRLTFRADDIAKVRALEEHSTPVASAASLFAEKIEPAADATTTPSRISSPPDLKLAKLEFTTFEPANTPISGAITPNLKMTKGEFPTFAPANTPVSGTVTPNAPTSTRRSRSRWKRGWLTPRDQLSKIFMPKSIVPNAKVSEVSDSSPGLHRTQTQMLSNEIRHPPTEVRRQSLPGGFNLIGPGGNMTRRTIQEQELHFLDRPGVDSTHMPGDPYFTIYDIGYRPTSGMKLRAHSSGEVLQSGPLDLGQIPQEKESRRLHSQPQGSEPDTSQDFDHGETSIPSPNTSEMNWLSALETVRHGVLLYDSDTVISPTESEALSSEEN
ncbi:hypothetical protein B0H66DRAFT_173046 [Apodospora peruviana]|uniref:Uncharacterized protein n=1 Tax=Apodospora peruviana TaxID=516989 RepID=A0AAE0M6S0_9PEZI|nr:hypothetical protein B0H66DRAFT_173046 [Apodospora peruviana]